MKPFIVLTLALTLTACAAPPPGIAPQQIPPEYAGYIVAQASATAGAMATQNAGATATEAVARATSTAAYLSTRDTLAMRVTELAMGSAQTQQSVSATDAASIKTETARREGDQATQAASARVTQSAFIAERAARDESDALAWSAFWSDLRDVAWYTVVALAVMACVMFGVWGLVTIRVRQIDALVQVMLRTLPPTHMALPDLLHGMVIQALPAPPQLEAPNDSPSGSHEYDWRIACKKAVLWCCENGEVFSESQLAKCVANPDGSTDWAAIKEIRRTLATAGVWLVMDRKGTVWAAGWDRARFEREWAVTPLLYLPETAPPLVRTPLRSSVAA